MNENQTELTALHRALESSHSLLADIKRLLATQNVQLAIGGEDIDRRVENWPIAGRERYSLSNRRAAGNDGLSIPAQATPATLICPANPARLGGSIVNSGTNSVILYLSGIGRAGTGVGALWLAASGGSWDFRLADVIWCGSVSAISSSGTTIIWAQV